MGAGKTLFTTIYAVRNQNKYNRIISNYKIKIEKAEFSTFPLINIDDENCLLIYDDVLTSDKKLLSVINGIIASISRKKLIDIFITTQRSVNVIDKTLRQLSYIIIPQLVPEDDELNVIICIEKNYNYVPLTIYKPYARHVREFYDFYDTNEITAPLTLSALLNEIKKLNPESQKFYLDLLKTKYKKI